MRWPRGGPYDRAMAGGDAYGLGPVSDGDLDAFREWLIRSRRVTPRVAGDYRSRLKRALRVDDPSTLTAGVQANLDTAVRAFVEFRGR